jgi:hypothetical protein
MLRAGTSTGTRSQTDVGDIYTRGAADVSKRDSAQSSHQSDALVTASEKQHPDPYVIVTQPEKIPEQFKPTVGKYQLRPPNQHAGIQSFQVQRSPDRGLQLHNFRARHPQKSFRHPILPSTQPSPHQSTLEAWVMNSEPVTRPMSQEKLIAVLQEIYGSLVVSEMVYRSGLQANYASAR